MLLHCTVSANRIRGYFAFTILLAGVSELLKQAAVIFDLDFLNAGATYLLLSVAGGMSWFIIIMFFNARRSAQKIRQRIVETEKWHAKRVQS